MSYVSRFYITLLFLLREPARPLFILSFILHLAKITVLKKEIADSRVSSNVSILYYRRILLKILKLAMYCSLGLAITLYVD